MAGKLTIDEFAVKVKEKYPEYADVDNRELTDRIVKKYPEYLEQVDTATVDNPVDIEGKSPHIPTRGVDFAGAVSQGHPTQYAVNGKKVSRDQLKDALFNQDFVTKLQSGEAMLDIKDDPEMEQLAKRQFESGTRLGDKWDYLKAGTAGMGAGVAGFPHYIGQVVREIVGSDAPLTMYEQLSKDASKALKGKEEEIMNRTRQYEDGFVDAIKKGNMGQAVDMGFNTVVQSAPISIGAAVTGGVGGLPAALGTMAGIVSSSEYAGSDSYEGLTNAEKLIRSTAMGTLEAAGEVVVTGKILTKNFKLMKEGFRGMVRKAGEEGGEVAAKEVAEGLAKKQAQELFKEYGIDILKEGGSEGFTQITQMGVDDLMGVEDYELTDYLKQGVEATALGMFAGKVMGVPTAAKGVKRFVDERLEDGSELKKAVDLKVESGIITPPVAEEIKQNIDARVEAVSAVPEDMRGDTKIVDLVEEKQKLEGTKERVDEAFHPSIDEQIKLKNKEIAERVAAKAKVAEPIEVKVEPPLPETEGVTTKPKEDETKETKKAKILIEEIPETVTEEPVSSKVAEGKPSGESLQVQGEVKMPEVEKTLLELAKEAINNYEENDQTVSDVADQIEAAEIPELQKALDKFREEQEYDRELSGRGDMDDANDKFMAAVEKYIAKQEKKLSKPDKTKVVQKEKQPSKPQEKQAEVKAALYDALNKFSDEEVASLKELHGDFSDMINLEIKGIRQYVTKKDFENSFRIELDMIEEGKKRQRTIEENKAIREKKSPISSVKDEKTLDKVEKKAKEVSDEVPLKEQKRNLLQQMDEALVHVKDAKGNMPTTEDEIKQSVSRLKKAGFEVVQPKKDRFGKTGSPQVVFEIEGDGTFKLGIPSLDSSRELAQKQFPEKDLKQSETKKKGIGGKREPFDAMAGNTPQEAFDIAKENLANTKGNPKLAEIMQERFDYAKTQLEEAKKDGQDKKTWSEINIENTEKEIDALEKAIKENEGSNSKYLDSLKSELESKEGLLRMWEKESQEPTPSKKAEKIEEKKEATEPKKLRVGEAVTFKPHDTELSGDVSGVVDEVDIPNNIVLIRTPKGVVKTKSYNGNYVTHSDVLSNKELNVEHGNSKKTPEQIINENSELISKITTALDDAKLKYDDVILTGSFVKKDKSNDIDLLIKIPKSEIRGQQTTERYENALANMRHKGLPINVIEASDMLTINQAAYGRMVSMKEVAAKLAPKLQWWEYPKLIASQVKEPPSTLTKEEPKLKEKTDKVISKLKKLKLDTKGGEVYSLPFPPQIWNTFVDIVVAGIETGKAIADAISDGVAWLKKNHPDQDVDAYSTEMKKFYDDEVEAMEAEKPKEKSKGIGDKKKTILTGRAYEGKTRDEVKRYLEEKGLTRPVVSQEERSQQAKEFIQEYGEETAIEAVKNFDVRGGQASSILAQIIKRINRDMAKLDATNTKELDALAKEYADVAALLEKEGFAGGEFAGQLAYEYQDDELGFNVEKLIEKYKEINKGEIPAETEAKFRELARQNAELQSKIDELEKKRKEAEEKAAIADIKESIEREKKTRKEPKIYGTTRIKKGFDDLVKALGEPTPGLALASKLPSVTKALVEIGQGLIETGKANLDNVLDKIKAYLKEQNLKVDFDSYKEDVEAKLKSIPTELRIPHTVLRDLVERGVDNIEDLTTEVQKLYPDATQRQVRDAITGYGKVVNPNMEEIEVQIRKMKRVGRIISALEDVNNNKRPLKSGKQRDKLDAQERALNKELREAMKDLPMDEATEAEQLKTQLDAAKQRVRNQIEDLQREINKGELTPKNARTVREDAELKELKEKRDELKKEHEQIFKDEDFQNKKRLELTKKAAERRIEELKRRIKEKDFTRKKKPLVTDDELTKLKAEKLRLKEEYEKEFHKAELENRTKAQKLGDMAVDAWNMTRILSATAEWSFVLRQGMALTLRNLVSNPKTLAKAFKNAWDFQWSEKKTEDWLRKVKAQDYYPMLKESKLALTEPSAKMSAREEFTNSNWARIVWDMLGAPLKLKSEEAFQKWSNLNPMRGIERASVGYLDTLRLARFLDGKQMLEKQGITFQDNPQAYKDLADVINTFTGRASLGAAERHSEALTKIFFSPRFWASQIKTATPYAFYHFGKMREGADGYKPTVAQKEAIANYSASVGITMSMVLLAASALNNDDDEETGVEFDPRSSDFLKIRLGQTRVDPWAGMQQQIVLTARLIAEAMTRMGKWEGAVKKESGELLPMGYKTPSVGEALWKAVTNKLSPSASLVNEALTTKLDKDGNVVDSYGNPFSLGDEVLERLYPMYFGTIKDLLKDDPTAMDGFLIFMAGLGWGVSEYDKKEKKPKKKAVESDIR